MFLRPKKRRRRISSALYYIIHYPLGLFVVCFCCECVVSICASALSARRVCAFFYIRLNYSSERVYIYIYIYAARTPTKPNTSSRIDLSQDNIIKGSYIHGPGLSSLSYSFLLSGVLFEMNECCLNIIYIIREPHASCWFSSTSHHLFNNHRQQKTTQQQQEQHRLAASAPTKRRLI